MNYLADTQIFIWAILSPQKLSPDVQSLLQHNTIWVSQISLFEIAIKQKIGKLPELPLTTMNWSLSYSRTVFSFYL